MIFSHTLDAVLNGTKTQTRRLVKPGEHGTGWPAVDYAIQVVHIPNVRVKWWVGRTYAVQPGRGQKAVARIRITAIRRERVQEMLEEDVAKEGFPEMYFWTGNYWEPRWELFIELWNRIHTKPGERWEDNPEVWVLEFELVEDNA